MITVIDLKKAMIQLLKKKYSYPVYSNDVIEGYERPSFFVQLKPVNISDISVNRSYNKYQIYIIYFQKVKDEVENLKKIDELKELIGMKVTVNQQLLQTSEFEFEWVGEREDILQVSFLVEYFETKKKAETSKKAEHLYYQTKGV